MSHLWDQAANDLGRPPLTLAAPQPAFDMTGKQHFDMEAAIRFAVAALEIFWQSVDGARARRLLANERIELGRSTSKDLLDVVYIDGIGTGLHMVTTRPAPPQPVTTDISERTVVDYFANYGPGNNDPHKVREIVAWIRTELDLRAAAIHQGRRS